MTLDTPHVIWLKSWGKTMGRVLAARVASLGEMVGDLAPQGYRRHRVSQRQRTRTGNSLLPIN